MINDGKHSDVPTVSIIIPTLNECANVEPTVAGLDSSLQGVAWEVVFVDDDSRDGTADLVMALARGDPRVRLLRRIGRRGLASACIEGVLATTTPVFVVMDADLQHDPSLIPDLLRALGDAEVAIGSRYTSGGDGAALGRQRSAASRFATLLSRLILRQPVADPMSGFFAMRRQQFDDIAPRLSGVGFKVLLDILASAKTPLAVAELPFRFRRRQAGHSKLSAGIVAEYLMLLIEKLCGGFVPARYLLFSAVGGTGLVVHLVMLALCMHWQLHFALAQALATFVAMTSNFFLNNLLTYADQRRRGWGVVTGLASFYVICSIGAVANVGIANAIYEHWSGWWQAGLAGALVGSVWNYAVSSVYTWRH
ncbi:MAG: glycosyltransferase family 2 protein [Reyranellaceae bacterium]